MGNKDQKNWGCNVIHPLWVHIGWMSNYSYNNECTNNSLIRDFCTWGNLMNLLVGSVLKTSFLISLNVSSPLESINLIKNITLVKNPLGFLGNQSKRSQYLYTLSSCSPVNLLSPLLKVYTWTALSMIGLGYLIRSLPALIPDHNSFFKDCKLDIFW